MLHETAPKISAITINRTVRRVASLVMVAGLVLPQQACGRQSERTHGFKGGPPIEISSGATAMTKFGEVCGETVGTSTEITQYSELTKRGAKRYGIPTEHLALDKENDCLDKTYFDENDVTILKK